MQLPKATQTRLAQEFRFSAQKMAETPNLQTKLYFFSALYGEVSRVLNQVWDSELSLLHLVLQSSHRMISSRVAAYVSGAERTIPIPEDFPEALDATANALAEVFEEPEIDPTRLGRVLAKIAALAYVTTGNGYYLHVKGALKV